MSAASELISQREFARRDGCSERRVRNGVRDGHLPRLAGHLLPADLVGTGWRARNRQAADIANASPEHRLPEEAATVAMAINGGAFDIAVLLLRRGMPIGDVREFVADWAEQQRKAWTGGPGLSAAPAQIDWPPPPHGIASWNSHPAFCGSILSELEWGEAQAEAGRP